MAPFVQRRRYRRTNKSVDLTKRFRHNHSNKNKNQLMKIKLGIGDALGYDGERQTVVGFVGEHAARIAKQNGETTLIPAKVELYFRLAIGGEQELQNFLQSNALDLVKLNDKKPGEEKDESNMKNGATQKAGLKKPVGTDKPIAKPRGGLAAEALAAKRSGKEIRIHALAKLFPEMDGIEFSNLVTDIKENGMREKITTLDGEILDGRNRYKACIKAEVKPQFEKFKGEDATAFVISKNIHRRHLTESQRAAIAAEISTTTRAGGDHSVNLPIGEVTNAQAADQMKVSEKSVRVAKKVKAKSPRLAKKVREGKISLHAAAKKVGLVKDKKEKQEEIILPKSSSRMIMPDEFEFQLDSLEKLIPKDCNHKPYAVIATKFVQRQMNLDKK